MTRQINIQTGHDQLLPPPPQPVMDADGLMSYILERSLNSIQVGYVWVTPELAKRLLMLVDPEHQRKVNPTRVAQYASDMMEDLFKFAESAIVIDTDYHMVNGQHRCMASVKSGCGFYAIVAIGVEPDDIKNMDQGKPRTVGENLKLDGVANYNKVAAVAKTVMSYERVPDRVWNASNQPTKAEVHREVLQHLKEYEEVAAGELGRAVGSSAWGAFKILASRHSPNVDALAPFALGVETGAGLAVGSPMLAYRAYLMRVTNITTLTKAQADLMALMWAWNKHVRGDPMMQIKTPSSARLPMHRML